MATIKNDRDSALQNRGVNARIMNPVVTVAVTSTGPTGTPYFTFADNSTTSLTPASITLTATATTAGSYTAPSYVWYYSTQMDPTTWVAIAGATTTGLTVTAATFRTQLSTGANVNYKVVVSQAGWSTTSVITSIDGYKNINSPPLVSISKENILLPSSSGVIDYSSSGTDILVSLAGTNIPYDATNSLANTFTVSAANIGTPTITVGGATTVTTTVTNDTRRFGTLSGISSSTGTALVVYTITVRDVNGKVYTYTKNQNISVAVQGQSAKTLSITSDSLIFARDATNVIANPSFIKLTANKQNTVNTVTWATSPAVTLYTASTGGATTTTGDVVYMRSADYGANTYVTVTASITADSLTDTTAIASVKAGSLALQAVLSNYSAPLPTTTAGVTTYTGSGTTIQVYEGTTLRTITGVTATGTNITPGAVTGLNSTTVTIADHTTITANNASIKYALTITRGDGTSDSSISITQAAYKSLQGATGGAGATGNSIYTATVYQQSSSVPATPVATSSTFNFSTNVLTPPAGWSVSQPATTTTPTYACDYTFVGAPGSTITGVGSWSAPYVEAVAGSGATAYWLVTSAAALQKNISNVFNPTSITATGYSAVGTSAPAVYAGRFKIYENGSATAIYTSAADESLKVYAPSAGTVTSIKVELYLSGGTTTKLDEQTIPVVSDGATGNAIIGVLSNETSVLPADNAGTVSSFAGAATTLSIFNGVTDDSANWTYSVVKTNVTCTEATTSRTQTVTALSADIGYIDFTATRTGFSTVAKRYVISKAKGGAAGGAGAAGEYRDIIQLYLQSATAPTKPTSVVYTFTGSVLGPVTGGTAGWSMTMPASTTTPTYLTTCPAATTTPNTAVTLTGWSAPAIVAQNGSVGADGNKTVTISAFQWASTPPAAVTTTAIGYTFATGAISAFPTGWTGSAGAAGATGQTLYQLNLILSTSATGAVAYGDWVNSVRNTIGYRNDGSTGPQGQSARTAYVVTTTSTVPGAVTAGTGDVPPTNTVANSVTSWSYAATSSLAAGQYMYQVDGLYTNGGNVTWGNPYLSNLKVGSLSAIAADLGSVSIGTVGALNSVGKVFGDNNNGVFLGYNGTAYKFEVGSATAAGISWDGSQFKLRDTTGGTILTAGNIASDIRNTAIGITSAGAITGIGLGSGGAVANSVIGVTPAGAITGIGLGSGGAVANSAISINANGTLTGAGSGQVSISGLGYTGALDATSGPAINKDPMFTNSAKWVSFSGPLPTFATVADGYVGSTVARSQSNASNWFNESPKTIINPSRRYKVSAYMRTVSGTGNIAYMGVALYNSLDVNIAGDGSQWYYAASGVTVPTAWTLYSGEFGFGTGKPFPAGAVTMTPLAILSYNGTGTNVHEIQNLIITDVTDSYNASLTATWTGVSGVGKPADNANATYIDANGAIQGVTSGGGTSVANTNIGITGAGAITGIGLNSGGAVANSAITITGGSITGIGTGANTVVDNSVITVSGRNILTKANVLAGGATVTTGYDGLQNAFQVTLPAATNYRIQNWTTHDVGAYSISFWAKASVATSMSFDLCDQALQTVSLTTSWQYFKYENLSINSVYLNTIYFGFLDFNPASACTLYVSNVMLEFSNKASAWTPAPEDTQNANITVNSGVLTGIGTSNVTVDNSLVTTVNLVAYAGMTVSGNTIWKSGGVNATWDAQVISKDSYTGGAYTSFIPAQTNCWIMAGLNTDPYTDASYGSIDYAWYMIGDTSLNIYENGTSIGNYGTYATGDVLSVTYDGTNVKYLKNGAVLRTVAATITAQLFFDSSFYSTGAKLTNIQFGPMSNLRYAIDAVPIGKNLIPNSDQYSTITWSPIGNNPNGATFDTVNAWARDTWNIANYVLPGVGPQNVWMHQSNIVAGGDNVVACDIYPLGTWDISHSIPCTPGLNYIFSVYVQTHRCKAGVGIQFFDAANTYKGAYDAVPTGITNIGGLANDLALYTRISNGGVAPTGATYMRVYLRKYNSLAGTTESYMWYAAPMLEQTNASTPSPYNAGPAISVTQLGYSGALNANNTYVDTSGNIQGVSSGAGKNVANNVDSRITDPAGGIYTTQTSSVSGALKIQLPTNMNGDYPMVRFTVDIYEYSTGYSCKLELGGHTSGWTWYNVFAQVIGGNVEYPVYFGHNGTNPCIWISGASETWSYPQVRIHDVFVGYSATGVAKWESGWVISFDTATATNVTGTVVDTYPGANWAKTKAIPTNLSTLTGSEPILNSAVGASNLIPTGNLSYSVGTGGYGVGAGGFTAAELTSNGLLGGETVTLSAWFTVDTAAYNALCQPTLYWYNPAWSWSASFTPGRIAPGTPVRASVTFTMPSSALMASGLWLGLYHQAENDGTNTTGLISVDRIQLELGSVATPYRAGQQAGATANQSDTTTNNAIAAKLNKSAADTLTGPITLNLPNTLLVGTTADGVYMGSGGIVGKKAGNVTFSVGSTGDAVFAGTLSAASGNFQGSLNGANITGATGTFSGNLSAGTVDFTSSVGLTLSYTAAGTYSVTVPAGLTKLRATLWGGGGGGGGGSSRLMLSYSGGGGSSGGYVTSLLTVTPGQVLTVVVGAGGAPGGARDGIYSSGSNGNYGEATSITGLLSAAGGNPGLVAQNTPTGGAAPVGGTAGATGFVTYYNTGEGMAEGWPANGGAGGNSTLGTGGAGGIGNSSPGGQNGGVAAGGGGGGQNNAHNGVGMSAGFGGRGQATLEFYDPNGVILKSAFDLLKSELRAQGHILT